MGASDDVIISLAPKSVTTPIAMAVTESLNGIPSLTAAIVVLVGLFGAVCGFKILQVGRVKSPYRPKPEHGHGFARRRDIACHGIRAYLWGVCRLRIDSERVVDGSFTPLMLHLLGIV